MLMPPSKALLVASMVLVSTDVEDIVDSPQAVSPNVSVRVRAVRSEVVFFITWTCQRRRKEEPTFSHLSKMHANATRTYIHIQFVRFLSRRSGLWLWCHKPLG